MGRTWTVAEIAEYLQVHPLTVRRWIRAGELEAFSLGRTGFRVRDEVLEAFLQTRRYVASGPKHSAA